MDQNIDERLKSIEEKIEAIHHDVKKMRSAQRTATAMRAVYWLFIILATLGAFYFVKPYVSQLKDAYGIGDTSNKDGSINQLLNELKDFQSQTDY